jgi:hypothetical protein
MRGHQTWRVPGQVQHAKAGDRVAVTKRACNPQRPAIHGAQNAWSQHPNNGIADLRKIKAAGHPAIVLRARPLVLMAEDRGVEPSRSPAMGDHISEVPDVVIARDS